MRDGGLPPLINLLRSENEKIQELAVLTMRNLSNSADNKVKRPRRVVSFLSFFLLMAIDHIQLKITRLGGIAPLVGLLEAENDRVVEAAAGALWSLSVSPEAQTKVGSRNKLCVFSYKLSNSCKWLTSYCTSLNAMLIFAPLFRSPRKEDFCLSLRF